MSMTSLPYCIKGLAIAISEHAYAQHSNMHTKNSKHASFHETKDLTTNDEGKKKYDWRIKKGNQNDCEIKINTIVNWMLSRIKKGKSVDY